MIRDDGSGTGVQSALSDLGQRGRTEQNGSSPLVQKAGISAWGAFIIGMDTDTKSALQRRADYIVGSMVDIRHMMYLTPIAAMFAFGTNRVFGKMVLGGPSIGSRLLTPKTLICAQMVR